MILLFILTSQVMVNEAYSKNPPQVYINSNPVLSDVKPFVDKQYRTMVPLRLISEGLGFNVCWDQNRAEISVSGQGMEIVLKPGSKDIYINDKLESLESAPVRHGSHIMVPLRFIAENLAATVQFNKAENSIDITVGRQVKPVYYRDKIVVLLYHHIDPSPSSLSTITPETFKSHLDMLKARGFNVVPIEDIKMLYQDSSSIPPNALAITFDDGYESFYTYAYPELIARNMVATHFLIVGRVGNKTGEIPKLDWTQLKEMQEEGMSFYSHTFDSHFYGLVNHWGTTKPVFAYPIYREDLSRFETDVEYMGRVIEDFKKAKKVLEAELGGERDMFAIPYGYYNQHVLSAAAQVGYRYIFSVEPGINSEHTKPTKILRINAGHPDITADVLKNEIFQLLN